MAPSPWLVALLFGAGAFVGVACTGPLPGSEDGEASSDEGGECPIGSLNCPCTAGGTCDSGLVCASKKCTEATETGETGEDSTGDSPTSTTTLTETTSASACDPGGVGAVDGACPPGQPYCLAGDCVDCTAINCGDVTPGQPVCNQSSGLCDVCACDDANPVCDPEAHTCGKCSAHDQCSGSACDLWTGGCMPVAAALWVDGAGACSDTGAGTQDDPLCTLGEAFLRVDADPQTAHAVRVRPADYAVDATLTVPAGGKVALVHATGGDGDPAVKIMTGGARALAVAAGGALLVDAVALVGAGDDAITCATGGLWLDRLRVSGGSGHGIDTDGCDVVLRRSVLTGNTRSGANVSAGTIRIENSFISSNGNTNDGGGGVYLSGGAALDAVYTSFIDNLAVAGTPFSVACNEDMDPAVEEVVVRNSVAINNGTNTLCLGSTIMTTGWSAKDGQEGATNIAIPFTALDEFLTPDPQIVGVYRAITDTALDDLAKWEAGDPEIDFDGDMRPSSESSSDYAGADRAPL